MSAGTEHGAGITHWAPSPNLAKLLFSKPRTLTAPLGRMSPGDIRARRGRLVRTSTRQAGAEQASQGRVQEQGAGNPWRLGLTPTCWFQLLGAIWKVEQGTQKQSLISLSSAAELPLVATAPPEHPVGRRNRSHVELESLLPTGLQRLPVNCRGGECEQHPGQRPAVQWTEQGS